MSNIQAILNHLVTYSAHGGLHHGAGCALYTVSLGGKNAVSCDCGHYELTLLVEGETLKNFPLKSPKVVMNQAESIRLQHLKRQGLVKLWNRKDVTYAKLTKTGAAFVQDHRRITDQQ